ncbi:MAG: AbiEi antitoxin N-terminal domain-containing protein [Pseudomonadota bacterium]
MAAWGLRVSLFANFQLADHTLPELASVHELAKLRTRRMQNAGKLNRLQHLLLVTAQWLEARGYSRALRSKYVASGWLEQPARGVFTRPGGIERWEQLVVSLQSLLRLPVAVGGRTAHGLQGYEHYLPLGEQGNVHLFSETAVPGWLSKLSLGRTFELHNASRLFPGCCIADGAVRLPDPTRRALRDSPTRLPNGLTTAPWG